MCMPPVPRLEVDRDTTPPVEPRYGLFSTASIIEDMEPHAHNGVQSTALCDPAVKPYPIAPCNPGDIPTNPGKTGDRSLAITTADPFAIYAAETCFPGGQTATEARDRLRRRITLGERHTVEAIIYNGLSGARPFLRDPEATILADGEAVPLTHAVGLLEQRLAVMGRTGTIHAPRWLAPMVDDIGMAHRDGPQLRTLLGTSIAFGSGYSGQAPRDTPEPDPDTVWLYATAPVVIRRSAIIEPATWEEGAFNPRTNQPFLLTERVYVVDWPCEVVAVRTDVVRYPGVAPVPSDPAPGMTLNPANGEAPLEVTATLTNWGNGPMTLDWGDGSEPETVDDRATVTHTYTEAGDYTITATSQADPGATTTATVTVLAPVAPPTNVAGTDLAAQRATVTWDWSQGGGPAIESFTVRHREVGGAWSEPDQVAPDDRSHLLTGLTASTDYEVGVSAHADGRSSAEATALLTTTGPVAAPVATAGTPTDTTIPLTWTWDQDGGEPVEDFQVRHRESPDGAWSQWTALGAEARSHTVTGLTSETTYDIEVRAVGVTTTASDAVQATTTAPT